MSGAWRDVRLAARNLARRPGFALGVILTLGLGIGATTTIYAVVDGVMLRPLPYHDPSALVAMGSLAPGAEWIDREIGLQDLDRMSMANSLDYQERTRSFENLAAIWPNRAVLSDGAGGSEMVGIVSVSQGLFDLLGASPALGRTFLPEEYDGSYWGSQGIVMLSYGAWQRRYGGDPDVLGRSTEGLRFSATIVGVLPRDFRLPEAFLFDDPHGNEFWFPFQWDPNTSRRNGRLYLLGHLDPRASVEQARAEAERIAADLAVEFPDDNVESDGSHVGIGVNDLHAQTVGTAGKAFGLFLGAAGLLLLLAAMNASTLLLARSLDRTQELGVRMALGAGRSRVVRLLVSEAGILSVLGGALGIGLAYGGVGVFLRYAPSYIPRLSTVAVDARVLAVAAAVSLGTGIAAGLLPALRLTRSGPWRRLQTAGRTFVEPSSRLREALVGGQMAVAVILLSGAGLLFNSFVRMNTVDPGFEAGPRMALLARCSTSRIGARFSTS